MQLEIVYEDADLVAINKPHGLLVHRTKIAADADIFALQLLRDQIQCKVYPCHRIDRKTSGVLLFAKNKETEKAIQKEFMLHKVDKTYHAIVRGWVPDSQLVDYAIAEQGKEKKEAQTSFKCLRRFEIDLPLGKFNTSRYSLIEVNPRSGRFHQIRKHMSHIFHPIIGDRPHGCSKQNRMWKSIFNMTSMMLHASNLRFSIGEDRQLQITARRSREFDRVLKILSQHEIKIQKD